MPNFKVKHEKSVVDTHTNTLDETHKKIMKTFQDKKCELPKKKTDLEHAVSKLEKLETQCASQVVDIAKQKSELKSLIKKLQSEISNIENNDDEFDYYYKTQDTIMDYYDLVHVHDENIIENNEQFSLCPKDKPIDKLDRLNELKREKNKPKKVIKRKKKNVVDVNKPNIFTYFKCVPKEENNEVSRASLLDKYMMLIDSEHMNNKNKDKQPIKYCGTCMIEKILLVSDGIYTCQNCGGSTFVIIDNDKPNYKDSSNDNNKTCYPYKRSNHLNEILSQFCAKQSISLPPEVYDNILSEIKKNRLDLNKLDIITMKREILKPLSYEAYYEHIVYIMCTLNNQQPPSINKETEDKIKLMFRQIQPSFNKHRPNNRINFLSYSYCVNKIFQLLELDEFLKYFALLKSREKLILQDELWKKICYDLNWKFYSSV